MHFENAEAFALCLIYTIDSHGRQPGRGKSGTQLGVHKGCLIHLVTLFFGLLSYAISALVFV